MSGRLSVMSPPGMSPSDEGPAHAADAAGLVEAALAGSDAAWSTLIARHEHKVKVALLARGVPLERARELTQETWLRLMEQQRAGRLNELSLPGLAIVQARFLAANDRRRNDRVVDGAS